jgi:hypothetical protein
MKGLIGQLSCDGTPGHELLTEFAFFESFACTYINPVGLLTVGMFVFGAVGMSIYIRTDSVVLPVILMLTTGGVTLSVLAAPASAIATVTVLVAGAGVITLLYARYSR